MTNDKRSEPVSFKGVMVSSTFTDLVQHRKALIKAIDGQKLKAVAMENDAALPAIDLIDSSLKMVGDAAAYIGVISHTYGQVPRCPDRNPDGLSLTELEFNEARRLSRPILLFIMGDEHYVKKGGVETDPEKMRKLEAFLRSAKRIRSDSDVHRVYAVFNDLHDFEVEATKSVAELRRNLDQMTAANSGSLHHFVLPSNRDEAAYPPATDSPNSGFNTWLTRIRTTSISTAALQSFQERLRPEIIESRFEDTVDTNTFLEKADLAIDGKLFATGALLFLEQPERLIQNALVQCVEYFGLGTAAGQDGRTELCGPIITQLERAMAFVTQRIEKVEVIEPGQLTASTNFQYPVICLREVLANALCHRDYTDAHRHIHVSIFKDRIEISNPGFWIARPLEDGKSLRLSELPSHSACLNVRLASALRWVGLVETQGSGIPNALSDCEEQNADEPVVTRKDGMVQVTVYPRRNWDRYSINRRGPSAEALAIAAISDLSSSPIHSPRTFYAMPTYIGAHKFVGREAQLDTLSDWAAATDPHPVLLFEAIGGAGKSMLTWEWTTRRATTVRDDWAGRFWYSFYERGAVMADFCSRALAYITGRPLKDFRKKKTLELSELLLHQLRARPWLIVLDGLERVLVAYHRFDAAQLADEEAGTIDKIAQRDPCAAIRPEDDDLLRALAAAAPSKLLLTSRLIPRVLLNSASQPIPGVLHERLPGLRPADAEALLRSCGVTGTSADMQNYLKTHCDCHPLVTGVLAGLINDYLPDRGNFDAWAVDPRGGASLNLANLDLVQKRNHILKTALDALPERNRQLLSTLALLSEAVDYVALSALNPHLPPEPEEVKQPEKPGDDSNRKNLSADERALADQEYKAALQRRGEYEQAIAEYRQSSSFLEAPKKLSQSVLDLERRGLLQYDPHSRLYDLHPVVRGIVAALLRHEEKERYGQSVVDYFSRQEHSPSKEAEILDDVRDGLSIVRTLLQMERYQEAFESYREGLADALLFNLEAYPSVLSLLRPFFPEGWATLPDRVSDREASYLVDSAGYSLTAIGELTEALTSYATGLQASLERRDWINLTIELSNISRVLLHQNRIAAVERLLFLALELAVLVDNQEQLFIVRLDVFLHLSRIGRGTDAKEAWKRLDYMGRDWKRAIYRPGMAELAFATFCFRQGDLKEEHLISAEKLAEAGKSRRTIRELHRLRGLWQIGQRNWEIAAASLHEAVRMAREVEQIDRESECQLALAKFHLGRPTDARRQAEQLSKARNPSQGDLASLWFAIGDSEEAEKHALAAYKWAWADGEPYVNRYELNKARGLLEQLGAEIPNLPPYDPSKDEKLPWENDVTTAIERLRAERSKKAAEAPSEN